MEKILGCKRFILLAALLLVRTSLIYAEDIDLERIVVTPLKLEQSSGSLSRKVEVVGSEEIEESLRGDLSNVLTGIDSVNINSYGGLGASKTIQMRGSTASQVLVLVDGRPISSPRDGQADLSSIPIDNIDRIEIMPGPASSLYGASAMGGTVNIITKNPPKQGIKTEAFSSFGTFRTYTERLTHGARISKLGYIVNAGYQSSEGFRANSGFNEKDFNTKFEYQLTDNNKLNINSGFYTSKVGTPGKINSPDIDDKQAKRNNFLDLNWDFDFDETSGSTVRVYNNHDRLEFMENTTTYAKSIHTTTARGYDLQFDKKVFEFYQLISGFNYVTNINDSTESAKHEYTVRTLYLDNQLNLFEKLNLNLGLRLDDYSNFGTELNPGLNALYKFNANIKLHGMISRSFRVPTFNDLYWPNIGGLKGNPDLVSEKGITGEIGIESKINKYILTDVTYYRSDYNELIKWEEGTVWTPKNIGSAVINGIGFNNTFYLPCDFELGLNYNFLMAKDDKSNKYLPYQPKNKVNFYLQYKGPKDLLIKFKCDFTDKRFADFTNNAKVKQFYTLGINASKKFNSLFTCYAAIDNLLDKQYRVISGYPMPGFSITGGAKLEF